MKDFAIDAIICLSITAMLVMGAVTILEYWSGQEPTEVIGMQISKLIN